MKLSFLPAVFSCFFAAGLYAQPSPQVNVNDFKLITGCWEGSITYLDYSSGKTFSMPARLKAAGIDSKDKIIYFLSYPNEPKANGNDTLWLTDNGTQLNHERIVSKEHLAADSLKVITETKGTDGNDNKPAIISHTYILAPSTYSIKKEVRFTGAKETIVRNSFIFHRVNDCD